MAQVTIPVGGLHCQNCVASVKKALSALSGITEVTVSLEKGTALVTGEDIDVNALRSAIEELGFDAGHPV